MKKNSYALLMIAIILFTGGCASYKDLNDMWTQLTPPDHLKKYDKEKLTYSKELRAYVYSGHILMRPSGEKIRTEEEALEKLNLLFSKDKASVGEKTGMYATVVYTVPVGLALAAVNGIAMIPAAPYTQYKSKQRKRKSFKNYVRGYELLEIGKHKEARMHFMKAIKLKSDLSKDSNIFYKIAQTYEGEKKEALALDYYRSFVNHAIALYPDYFKKYNERYKNDLEQLDKEFTRAEERLSRNKP